MIGTIPINKCINKSSPVQSGVQVRASTNEYLSADGTKASHSQSSAFNSRLTRYVICYILRPKLILHTFFLGDKIPSFGGNNLQHTVENTLLVMNLVRFLPKKQLPDTLKVLFFCHFQIFIFHSRHPSEAVLHFSHPKTQKTAY